MAEKVIPAKLVSAGYRWATPQDLAARERLSVITFGLEALAKQRAALDAEEERLTVLRDHLPSAQGAKGLEFLELADGWVVKG